MVEWWRSHGGVAGGGRTDCRTMLSPNEALKRKVGDGPGAAAGAMIVWSAMSWAWAAPAETTAAKASSVAASIVTTSQL